MNLDRLLNHEGWTEHRLAEEVRQFLPRGAKTNQSTINRIRRRGRSAGLPLALAIERVTDGMVKAEELRLSPEDRRLLKEVRQGEFLRDSQPPSEDAGQAA